MSGNNTINVNGVYGTKGVSSPSNYPGGRHGSVSWIDSTGSLWIFGGFGYATTRYTDFGMFFLSANLINLCTYE